MAMKKQKPENANAETQVPNSSFAYAQLISAHGANSTEAVRRLQSAISANSLWSEHSDHFYQGLAGSLEGWDDQAVADVIDAITNHLPEKGISEGIISSLQRWIKAHANEPQKVIYCLSVSPPSEISILRLLSLAGSQKLVFLANWQNQQRQVVLKRLLDKNVISREMQSHPLSMAHPNIIETHFLQNDKAEIFLVERYLPKVLYDGWAASGIHEAANLLRDIASALAFVHERKLVHGDVKPDNIGVEDGNYILLDFGICRKQEEFETINVTGSLRTRAPELFEEGGKHSFASDIWALGATVFHAFTGRFPLFSKDEKIPRVSNQTERTDYVIRVEKRVSDEWDKWVDLGEIPDPLKAVLGKMLERNPGKRPTASEMVKLAESELSGFLRSHHGPSRFSPGEELDQLINYLPDISILKLMPIKQRDALMRRLDILESSKELMTDKQKYGLNEIRKSLLPWEEKA
jgi:serine/threonine protein kinase